MLQVWQVMMVTAAQRPHPMSHGAPPHTSSFRGGWRGNRKEERLGCTGRRVLLKYCGSQETVLFAKFSNIHFTPESWEYSSWRKGGSEETLPLSEAKRSEKRLYPGGGQILLPSNKARDKRKQPQVATQEAWIGYYEKCFYFKCCQALEQGPQTSGRIIIPGAI